VLDKHNISRDHDRSVSEHDNATGAWSIQLREGERMLLLFTDGAEPDASMIAL
jgi:hypothetical protein